MFGSRLFMKQSRFVSKDSKFRKVSKKVQSLESSSGKSFYAFLCGRPEVRSCTLSLRLPVCDIPADLLTEVETVEVEKSKHLTSLKREEEEREPRLSQKGSETKRIIEKRKRIYAWRRKAGVENAL